MLCFLNICTSLSCAVLCRAGVCCVVQVDKIVGRGAPAEFVKQLEALANSHHEDMGLDVIRAYHFGARYACHIHSTCKVVRVFIVDDRRQSSVCAVCTRE
jgi:hypothetical protein